MASPRAAQKTFTDWPEACWSRIRSRHRGSDAPVAPATVSSASIPADDLRQHCGEKMGFIDRSPSVFFHTLNVSKHHEYVHAAVGLHPELVASHERELPSFWPHLSATQFVGEVGLDYTTRDEELRDRQRRVFAAVLSRCADSGGKVLTVHSRRAARDVIAAVGRNYPGTVILHWFSGSLRELEAAIDVGCYFSVNPMMTTSQSGQKLIKAMPRERVLTESDGPFAQVQGRPAFPSDVRGALAGIASCWEVEVAVVAGTVHRNFHAMPYAGLSLSLATLTDGATIDRRASAATVLRESGPH